MGKLKVAKSDYTESMLPSTRKEVFFDVLKLNKRKLLTLSMIALLLTMPFIIICVISGSYESYLYSANASGLISAEETLSRLTSFKNLISLIKFVFYTVFAVGLAGLARVIKLFAWEENVNLSSDFIKGIKQNVKQYLLLGLLFGILTFLSDFVNNSFSGFFIGSFFIGYGNIMKAVCIIFLAPVGAYLVVTCCVYDLKFGQQIKYALLVYGKNFGWSLLALFCCLLVCIPQTVGSILSVTLCEIIGLTVSGILLPVVLLGWFCFAFSRLDKSVNATKYPGLVGRGLTKKGTDSGVKPEV